MPFIRNDLDLSSRLHLGYLAVVNRGIYGAISALAFEYQVSRWFIYQTCIPLWEEAQRRLQSSTISSQVSRVVSREERVLRLYLEGHASVEAIGCLSESLFGETLSVGWISQCLSQAGRRLPVRDRGGQSCIHVILADEIFAKSRPILVSVDPSSSYIYELRLVTERSKTEWQHSFSALCDDSTSTWIVGDQGKALRASAEDWGHYQSDHYHLLRPLSQLEQRLETRAYQAIEQEDRAAQDCQKVDDVLLHQHYQREYAAQQQLTQTHLYCYEMLVWLNRQLRHLFQPIHRSWGRLADYDSVLSQSQTLLEWMEELPDGDIAPVAQKLRPQLPAMLAYLQLLPDIQKRLLRLFKNRDYLAFFLRAYAAQQQSQAAHSYAQKKWLAKDALFWREALIQQWGQEAFERLDRILSDMLAPVVRASSMVENVNSRLRVFLQAAKSQISQERLNLIRFYLNHQTFKRGKRAGKSASQWLQKTNNESSWWQELQDCWHHKSVEVA